MRIAAALLAPLLFAPAPSRSAEISSPEALLDQHVEAFNRGDAKTLAALYADDAKLITPDGEVLRGRRNVAGYWGMLGSGRRLRLTVMEKETSGPLAYVIGNYSITEPTERGTFTIFFKRGSDGTWKIAASMWNEARSIGYTPLR